MFAIPTACSDSGSGRGDCESACKKAVAKAWRRNATAYAFDPLSPFNALPALPNTGHSFIVSVITYNALHDKSGMKPLFEAVL